jgi:hypothetical protein
MDMSNKGNWKIPTYLEIKQYILNIIQVKEELSKKLKHTLN